MSLTMNRNSENSKLVKKGCRAVSGIISLLTYSKKKKYSKQPICFIIKLLQTDLRIKALL